MGKVMGKVIDEGMCARVMMRVIDEGDGER
jgi:hypothetical protein